VGAAVGGVGGDGLRGEEGEGNAVTQPLPHDVGGVVRAPPIRSLEATVQLEFLRLGLRKCEVEVHLEVERERREGGRVRE
jgi:hypothetical protein